MQLFSTILPIRDTMTPDDFIRLVIDWNATNRYQENIVTGVQWNGEHSIRFGNEDLWMQIEEYRSQNILAVRYEKREKDGTVWDTDYVANFEEKKIAICLDRSYTEDALNVKAGFSTPHFISMLVDSGYLADDGKLPIDKLPVLLDEDGIRLLDGVADRTAGCRLPVVYVSKTRSGDTPVDVGLLASRLKGAAHILVQADIELEEATWEQLGVQTVKDGSVLVVYPTEAAGHKIFRYRAYLGNDKMFADRITSELIEYSNVQIIGTMYTWQGVANALLLDSLDRSREKVQESEKIAQEKVQELNDMAEYVGEDIEKLEKQIKDLTRINESLTFENQKLRAKIGSTAGTPVLFLGEEEEFFKDEIKVILLETLKNALDKNFEENTKSRRYDVIKDVVEKNPCKSTVSEKSEMLKNLFSGYSSVNNEMKQSLAEIGIEIKRGEDHYLLSYFGDDRYVVTIAKTPSDKRRGGLNTALQVIRTML